VNWELLLTKGLPIALKVLREVIDGISKGRTNAEIRQRVSEPDVILDDALDQLRDDEDDLLEFVRTGR
jgi:hypothetical protein